MLNRRILRVKVFKNVYSLVENPRIPLKELEVAFGSSCETTRDLYLFLLSIAGPVTSEACARIEAARAKFHPTEEELHPNLKFVGNRIAPLLEEDPDFSKIVSRKKLSWDQYDVLIRHLYEKIREREYFKRYLESSEQSLREDAQLWIRIFEREFEDNAELETILEDLDMNWPDDLPYALIWCIRSLGDIADGKPWSCPALYQSEMPGNETMDSDRAFALGILRKAYNSFEKYFQTISECTPKWDKSRICVTDLALIMCGLAEAEAFPSMPSKIVINEYVEISKYYSTPESRAFVNGVLDRLINKTDK